MVTVRCPHCDTPVELDRVRQVAGVSRVESPRDENVACPGCERLFSLLDPR